MLGKLKVPNLAAAMAQYQKKQDKEGDPIVTPVAYDPNLPDAIICDLDGTLALFGNRNPFNRDFENDQINEPVSEVVKFFWQYKNKNLIFTSGRDSQFRAQTVEFLEKNGFGDNYLLFMRPTGDSRDDRIIKSEIFDAEIRDKYNVFAVFDDRPKVVRFWRSIGLFVFDVNQSGREF